MCRRCFARRCLCQGNKLPVAAQQLAPADRSGGPNVPTNKSAVFLVNVHNMRAGRMDTPPFTYDAAFSPDGKRVLYAVTRGLGFGSEVWTMERNGHNREQVINDPAHIVAYPRCPERRGHRLYSHPG